MKRLRRRPETGASSVPWETTFVPSFETGAEKPHLVTIPAAHGPRTSQCDRTAFAAAKPVAPAGDCPQPHALHFLNLCSPQPLPRATPRLVTAAHCIAPDQSSPSVYDQVQTNIIRLRLFSNHKWRKPRLPGMRVTVRCPNYRPQTGSQTTYPKVAVCDRSVGNITL